MTATAPLMLRPTICPGCGCRTFTSMAVAEPRRCFACRIGEHVQPVSGQRPQCDRIANASQPRGTRTKIIAALEADREPTTSRSGRPIHRCTTPTKRGTPCPLNADRQRNETWYCHVHDPEGACQQQIKTGIKVHKKRSMSGIESIPVDVRQDTRLHVNLAGQLLDRFPKLLNCEAQAVTRRHLRNPSQAYQEAAKLCANRT